MQLKADKMHPNHVVFQFQVDNLWITNLRSEWPIGAFLPSSKFLGISEKKQTNRS